MRIIGFIEDREVVRAILEHLEYGCSALDRRRNLARPCPPARLEKHGAQTRQSGRHEITCRQRNAVFGNGNADSISLYFYSRSICNIEQLRINAIGTRTQNSNLGDLRTGPDNRQPPIQTRHQCFCPTSNFSMTRDYLSFRHSFAEHVFSKNADLIGPNEIKPIVYSDQQCNHDQDA